MSTQNNLIIVTGSMKQNGAQISKFFDSHKCALPSRMRQMLNKLGFHVLGGGCMTLFFFLGVFVCSQRDNHPKEDIATFACKPYMEYKTFNCPSIFLATQ
jgi:hypothetical protein